MTKNIDCLIIGHNQMDFEDYYRQIAKMGESSCAHRDLSLNCLSIDGKPTTLSEIVNEYFSSHEGQQDAYSPLSFFNNFSATIAYLGSYLNRNDFTFDFVHSFQDEKSRLREIMEENDVLLVAITTTFYITALPILEIVKYVKGLKSNQRIVIGGPFVATQLGNLAEEFAREYLLRHIGADFYVVSSQGETELAEILKALKCHERLSDIPNIIYATNGGYQWTKKENRRNALAENPVMWELFGSRVGESINIRTAISCPYACKFCGFPKHAGKYQKIPVHCLDRELKQIKRLEGLKSINFIDDTFNTPPKRFKEILRTMARQNHRIRWFCNYRCQFADAETIALMKESGCEGVFLGLESGSDSMLKKMGKKATVEEYYRGLELLKKNDILTFGSFIIGFPGETDQTVNDTEQLINYSGIDFYRLNLWYCEPIAEIWQERAVYNIEGANFEWSHATMNSREACDRIVDVYRRVTDPPWVPLEGFDIGGVMQMKHNGLVVSAIKSILRIYNESVREKLRGSANASRRELFEQFDRVMAVNHKAARSRPCDPGISGVLEIDLKGI